MGIVETLKPIGDFVSSLTKKVLELIPSELIASETTSRIITIFIYVGIIWALLKFAGSLSKAVKVVLIGLLALLIISVISTFLS